MSNASSNAGAWFSRLEPVKPPNDLPGGPDDPRLGEFVEFWLGGEPKPTRGRPVIIGFPQDEGVRRNHGRTGAAEAPATIRKFLYRLTPWEAENQIDISLNPLLDLGNVGTGGSLEESQGALGEVIGGVLSMGAVPIVLGGGHETAFGHYLGYVAAKQAVGIINLDAHLDVRPCLAGFGTSGTPFRQILELPNDPLPGERYVCLGAQAHAVSREHEQFATARGAVVRWQSQIDSTLESEFLRQVRRLGAAGARVYVSLDADVVQAADVPGVSAPNSLGLLGRQLLAVARLAGQSPQVASFDLVEINPRFDRDEQSSRWAALAVWHFLVGLATRHANP
jgi:formiminoglutamase